MIIDQQLKQNNIFCKMKSLKHMIQIIIFFLISSASFSNKEIDFSHDRITIFSLPFNENIKTTSNIDTFFIMKSIELIKQTRPYFDGVTAFKEIIRKIKLSKDTAINNFEIKILCIIESVRQPTDTISFDFNSICINRKYYLIDTELLKIISNLLPYNHKLILDDFLTR